MEESDLDAIHGLLLYIRNKGFTPRHPYDPVPAAGTYDKVGRTTANLDEAIDKLAHRTRTEETV
jgi:hypothetical protein